MSTPTLPAVIGPTENTLRNLLQRLISGGAIGGYEEWVYMNIRDSEQEGANVDERVADVLKQPDSAVAAIRTRLTDGGLLDSHGGLSQLGCDELQSGRELVSSTTQALTAGIEPADLQTTIETLDAVRRRAEVQLHDRARAGE